MTGWGRRDTLDQPGLVSKKDGPLELDHAIRRRISARKSLDSLVGLTRIELVTSSLSGMRSNQLSYSPEFKRGLARLQRGFVSLNRDYPHLFFKHGNSHSAHKIGDQVEDHRQQHPQACS